jgi:hypothetical protein
LLVFWSIDRTAGEAMVIGYLAADQSALVVAVGSQFTEMREASRRPTGRSEPPLGASYRREYMKRFPSKLRACGRQ